MCIDNIEFHSDHYILCCVALMDFLMDNNKEYKQYLW